MINRTLNVGKAKVLRRILVSSVTLLCAASANAGIHTWDVVEVFSNSDGTIQYIELFDFGAGGTETGVGNGALTSAGESYSWSNGPVATGTSGKSYLVATAGFAALPGAPVPDVIIPAANVPFFNTAGDTITFSNGDAFSFGPVPTNGTDSLDEATGVGANTPKNYAGVQGSVDAGGAPGVPSWSMPMALVMSMMLIGVGMSRLRRDGAES